MPPSAQSGIDSLDKIIIADFSGGLNCETERGDLKPNESPDTENLKLTQEGKAVKRGGYQDRITGLTNGSDGAGFLYDSAVARHDFEFRNGNLYDTTAFTATLVAAGVYSAGLNVGFTVWKDKLVFSDGETFGSGSGSQIWDPLTGTVQPIISSGSVGTIPTPAAKAFCVYAGSLIFVQPAYSAGVYDKDAFVWSNVNDETTILGTNIRSVGANQGGVLQCVQPFSVTAQGIPPEPGLFCGKSQKGIFGFRGDVLSEMTPFIVNCPTGVLDALTVQYISVENDAGYVIFVGTDKQVWACNGVNARRIGRKIYEELRDALSNIVTTLPNFRFSSVNNTKDQQYILSVGNDTQYVLHYDKEAWMRYRGWKTGYMFESRNFLGEAVVYCAGMTEYMQLDTGTEDGDQPVVAYWDTPLLKGKDPDSWKSFKFVVIDYATDSGAVDITARTDKNEGIEANVTIEAPAGASDGGLEWGVGLWGVGLWNPAGSGLRSYKQGERLAAPIEDNSGVHLQGYDLTVRVASGTVGSRFELHEIAVLYLPKGVKRVVTQ